MRESAISCPRRQAWSDSAVSQSWRRELGMPAQGERPRSPGLPRFARDDIVVRGHTAY